MLKKRARDFAEAVSIAIGQVGNSAPKIADAIMADVFPGTCRVAIDEGADAMLRTGIVAEVRRLLNKPPEDDRQADFSQIDPQFQPIVRTLKRVSYFVESVGEYVPVAVLVRNPALLNDARKYLRKHGEDTIAEATKLDELYAAVTAEPTRVSA